MDEVTDTIEKFFEVIHDEAEKNNYSVDELLMIWSCGIVAFNESKKHTLQNLREEAARRRAVAGKPAHLLDNASLTNRRVVPLAKPPSDNTSQLAIAARRIISLWNGNCHIDNLTVAMQQLETALQQQA